MHKHMANSKGKEYTFAYSGSRASLPQLFNFCIHAMVVCKVNKKGKEQRFYTK